MLNEPQNKDSDPWGLRIIGRLPDVGANSAAPHREETRSARPAFFAPQASPAVDIETARNRAQRLKSEVGSLLRSFYAETGWRPQWMNLFRGQFRDVEVESITISKDGTQTKV